jgi:magnesium-transporting ATPase (P-type)
MAVGTYTDLFQSAISPWTTLGPLAFVISVSLLVEGIADSKRHRSDNETNNAPCVVLRRADEIDADEHIERDTSINRGKDVVVNISTPYFQTSNNRAPETPVSKTKTDAVRVGFQKIRRMDIRQGHFVFVKNREMVPADMILLASSGDSGSAYIETSSIDGETNLKLRTSPHLPKKLLKHLRDGTDMDSIDEAPEVDGPGEIETLEQAAKRVTRFSALSHPDGVSALENPNYKNGPENLETTESKRSFFASGLNLMKESVRAPFHADQNNPAGDGGTNYIATLTSEPPNPHVNTFSGKLTLPPVEAAGNCHDIPLGAENILLRGAVIRNTEWVIGLACFTGTDTKLVQNSFDTPSKFSQLDKLMNKTVILIIVIMILCISYLSSQAVISTDQEFQNLW